MHLGFQLQTIAEGQVKYKTNISPITLYFNVEISPFSLEIGPWLDLFKKSTASADPEGGGTGGPDPPPSKSTSYMGFYRE